MVRMFLLFAHILLSQFLAIIWLTHLHVCLNRGSWLLPWVVWFLDCWSCLLAHSASNLTRHLWSGFNCLRLICLLVDSFSCWVYITQLVHIIAFRVQTLLVIDLSAWAVRLRLIVACNGFFGLDCAVLLWLLSLNVWAVAPRLLGVVGVALTNTWVGLVTTDALQGHFDLIFPQVGRGLLSRTFVKLIQAFTILFHLLSALINLVILLI